MPSPNPYKRIQWARTRTRNVHRKPSLFRFLFRTINEIRKMNTDKLKSRKLWITVIGAALISLGTQMGMDEERATQLVAIIASYLIGQGIADHGKK